MPDKSQKSMKVALPGMDGRARKTLAMFLQGPCKSADVVIVDDTDSQVDIIDLDLPGGKLFMARKSDRPAIVLSLKDPDFDGADTVLFLKKPVVREAMLSALDRAKRLIQNKTHSLRANSKTGSRLPGEQPLITAAASEKTELAKTASLKHFAADIGDRKKTSKHKTAMQMDEKSFTAYMGILPSLDIARPSEFKLACYNPKDYFQGYVQSAFKVASAKGQVLQLNSGWRQLLIFPHTHEIWLDADDKQLRAFAGITINKGADTHKSMSVTPPDPKTAANQDLDKFQSMDTLAWKLACWTSKGRYPQQIDIDQPIYLKHWPNFTRLLVTPHAMRIAALLVDKPRTAASIAQTLAIKPEYVFIFISAASAIGLLGQSTANAEIAVVPHEPKPDGKNSLFGRIISKLRANKE